METGYKFRVGDKVLAYSYGLLHVAKCLRRRITNSGEKQYFLRYKRLRVHDEWADEEKILNINYINLNFKERLKLRRKSNRVNKSRGPRSTKGASSNPTLKKRGSPQKNGENASSPPVPISIHLAISALNVENQAILYGTVDLMCNASVEIYIHHTSNVISRSLILADELKKLKLPSLLNEALDLDYEMHETYKMRLKFQEKNFVANVLYNFTLSSYFVDNDSQKKNSTLFPVILMRYLNSFVNPYLKTLNEVKYCISDEGATYFRQRLIDQPNIEYIFSSHLNPKRIWCYLYGPMYLLRLLVCLPKILALHPRHIEYDLDTFVLHTKKLIEYLENHFDEYFSENDYEPMEVNHKK